MAWQRLQSDPLNGSGKLWTFNCIYLSFPTFPANKDPPCLVILHQINKKLDDKKFQFFHYFKILSFLYR